MFKLVVLSALLALAAAKPGYLSAPVIATSAVVGSVPTSVSHSSNSVVHSAAIAAPALVAHAAPAVAVAHAAPALVAAHAAPALVSAHAAPAIVAAQTIVGSVPTSVSHSSSSVVHSAAIATPLIAAAPAVIAAHGPAVVSAHVASPYLAGHGAHYW